MGVANMIELLNIDAFKAEDNIINNIRKHAQQIDNSLKKMIKKIPKEDWHKYEIRTEVNEIEIENGIRYVIKYYLKLRKEN